MDEITIPTKPIFLKQLSADLGVSQPGTNNHEDLTDQELDALEELENLWNEARLSWFKGYMEYHHNLVKQIEHRSAMIRKGCLDRLMRKIQQS